MDDELEHSPLGTLIALLLKKLQPTPVIPDDTEGGGAFVMVPSDSKLQDLEKYSSRPRRIRQSETTNNPGSFVDLVSRFSSEQRTVVFCDPIKGTYKAVLDYHEDRDSPSWCDNSVSLTAAFSPQFDRWMKVNDKLMPQVELAQFIDDNSMDIVAPDAAAMLELALNLEMRQDVQFKGAHRLESGDADLTYNEKTEQANPGKITVPKSVIIRMPVFYGREPQDIPLRFKYRLQQGGALTLGFQIVRLQETLEKAGLEYKADLAKKLEDIPFFEGAHSNGKSE